MIRKWSILLQFAWLCPFAYPQSFVYLPDVQYDETVPTLKQVVGHDWGERITSHAEIETYIKKLVQSPKVSLVQYGSSWEGRSLYYLIIGSESNQARIAEVKAGLQKLADPRKLTDRQAIELIGSMPAVVWLAYAVHGNEISSSDAALLMAYHLAAAREDSTVAAILENTLVIIDPLQNPDGRDRFIAYYRQTQGRWPDADLQAAEHNEAWPGGRMNHYLFDMNRDWFAMTQPETRGRIRAFLEWYPQVFVDLHEMGSNRTYYFPPAAVPYNPEITPAQIQLLESFGKNNARWFDRFRFDYFTREVFDMFYPGYGEGWPMFQGAVGKTYEQASTRGLVVRREDETDMHYRETVQHHFIASLATAHKAANMRKGLLSYFHTYRREAVEQGSQETVREYIFPPGRDSLRTRKLVGNLMAQGIEVKHANAAFSNRKVKSYYSETTSSKSFPPGTYVVSLAQPAKHLAKTLLAKTAPMNPAFLQEQRRRYAKRLPDEIYDVTGWSLPLLYDLEAYRAETVSQGTFSVLTETPQQAGTVQGGKSALSYVIAWQTNAGARALAEMFRQKIRVYSSDKPFTMNGSQHPAGSLIIKTKDNPADLYERLVKIAGRTGIEIRAVHSSWVADGVNVGSPNVVFLHKPKVAMAYNIPVHPYSVGWTRYVLEQEYGYPVTMLNTAKISGYDMTRYNVLILPNSVSWYGSYSKAFGVGGAAKLKNWIENGGTLITFGAATRWLTEEKVGLLATNREYKGGKPVKEEAEKEGQKGRKDSAAVSVFDYDKAIQPERELPGSTPGAIMRVSLDSEHWLAFGYDNDTNVMVASRNIFTPVKLDKGRNVAVYKETENILLSGFTWEDAQKQLGQKAYLMHQRLGRGHVVAFAEEPNYRAFMDGLNLLFMNAVFFGPAH
jgi:hypothetical protein